MLNVPIGTSINNWKAETNSIFTLISRWPELKTELLRSGIVEYQIFLDKETGFLFAYQELVQDHTADELKNKMVVKKWWDYMKDIMETNPDNSPVITPLKKVFDIE